MLVPTSVRRIGLVALAVASLGIPVLAAPFAVQIDPAQSALTFQLCVAGRCDDDVSSVTGTATIALDCVDFPAGISLHDFHMYLTSNPHIYISWSFLGSLTADATNVSIHYAYPGAPMGPVPIGGGAFLFSTVPATSQGTLTYHAVGIPCTALGAAGYPCDDTRNLADEGISTSDWNGSLTSANRTVSLTTAVDTTTPLDPNNPSLGYMRVYGTVHGSAYVPRPLGDVDGDGDVDFLDFTYFGDCMAGPGVTTPPPGCSAYHFDGSDLNDDGDVDLADFAQFQPAILGA